MITVSIRCAECNASPKDPPADNYFRCSHCGTLNFITAKEVVVIQEEPKIDIQEPEDSTDDIAAEPPAPIEKEEDAPRVSANWFGNLLSFAYVPILLLLFIGGFEVSYVIYTSLTYTVLFLGLGSKFVKDGKPDELAEMAFIIGIFVLFFSALILFWEWTLPSVLISIIAGLVAVFVAMFFGAIIATLTGKTGYTNSESDEISENEEEA